jgi:hypothetical protein
VPAPLARERVLGRALGFLGPSLRVPGTRFGLLVALARRACSLLGLGGSAQRRLGRLVGLHPLTPGDGFVLGGVTYFRLGVSAYRGQLRLKLLGVGQHAQRVARAFQIGDQPHGYRAQCRAGEADRAVPPQSALSHRCRRARRQRHAGGARGTRSARWPSGSNGTGTHAKPVPAGPRDRVAPPRIVATAAG